MQFTALKQRCKPNGEDDSGLTWLILSAEMVLTEIANPHDADGPSLLLLSATLDPLRITPTAQRWLTEIDD